MSSLRVVNVYADLHGKPVMVGVLRVVFQRGQERSGFEYAESWLGHPLRYPLDPELIFVKGVQYPAPGRTMFNCFSDSSPDRWGRYLVARHEKYKAAAEKRSRRTLLDVDFLLGVEDEGRMGALRYTVVSVEGIESPFLSLTEDGVPPLVRLRNLQHSVAKVEARRETEEDLAMLMAPGSSLGGARPKATVRGETGELMIAKFHRAQDDWPVIRWETLMLMMAENAGIDVPRHHLELVDEKPVLLMERFDRRKGERLPFASALTMVGASDGESKSYLDLAEAILQFSSSPNADLRQLWRRMVFNVLTSNTDDHLRNHGFLHEPGLGWRLSPAYDMNPVPAEVGPRVMALALDEHGDRTGSLDAVIACSEYFGLEQDKAEIVAAEVAEAVGQWQALAHRVGLNASDRRHMESAFDHGDIEKALKVK
ncbi:MULTISPECIES: type II toxin-antitoxin system HipA family toxin [unclassified Marinobacter]|uniref:type II toxin-antitoxin system HipA family toxin n=1 Tax=unclassified Marinobacter TaxID=83889 RepID=UPI00200C3D41|nr:MULTISPECIES: type II toxin-antitoxin system HipA family toxin [unclassified Marinobacter]UQG56569.1 type II toxin-antitoxin system HipA family toxin [Marinobacter sp. M4C]UQG65373.1 type II toxin-antitoxin system HipA family toxin [Marinobacter sp. M2C]UQG69652.1 type II toxin-antitoxin system HipA family toxin [Marinobacter sp. M1C]